MKQLILTCLVIFTSCVVAAQQVPDSVAIRLVLEKESATWRSGDVKAHASCWEARPYSKIIVSLPDTVLDIPVAAVINPKPGSMGKGGYAVNSNYNMSIHGDYAWVSHNEESVAADGKHTHSYEIRMLEKINGQWKLVAQTIIIPKKQ
ncbi:MAG: endo-arabinase [Bacteroidetes bacterium]|nr:endo-arabinase [Bacteroidota bacterium]